MQTIILTSTTNGIYNTPVGLYALHSCQENKDYYLVNTGGDWTATEAGFLPRARKRVSFHLARTVSADFQDGTQWCGAGFPVNRIFGGGQERLCQYDPYPLNYEIDLAPPDGPTVVQVDAAPAGDQGLSASYTSGFSFSIGGAVEISGDGPSGGISAGATWENSTSITVPPLVVEAGDLPNEGAFTRYRYCTVGNTSQNCTSNIQLIDVG